MSSFLNPPLRPRRGSTLKVLTIERISTEHQDERSLDDQRAKSKRFVNENFDGEIQWKSISSRGSGEVTDRDSYREMEDLIDADWPDVIVVEDIGRICRRLDALRICESCEDHNTRLIALNDHVDTADPNWKMSAMFSTLHHERHNQDTSDRIKRTLRNRFIEGAILSGLPFGYVRPPGAKKIAEVTKDPAAEEIYEIWFSKLEDGASYSEVADWLNFRGVSTGPECQDDRWTCRMVGRVTHNPVLRGLRQWNERTTRRNNRTGKRRSVKASPEDRLQLEVPHLAFIEPARYDRIVRNLDLRNEAYRRGRERAQDIRQGMPRSRTVWPGQSMYCGVCGRVLYYGAHGQSPRLVCKGAVEYRCWNGASADGREASQRICQSVVELIRELPEFDEVLISEVRQQIQDFNGSIASRRRDMDRELVSYDRQIENVLKYVREGTASSSLAAELSRLEDAKTRLSDELDALSRSVRQDVEMPSAAIIRERGIELFTSMAPETPEFGRLMNRFIEGLVVHPVQLIDGGKVRLRANFTVNLMALIDGERLTRLLDVDAMRFQRQVDLFDVPQRVGFMDDVIRLGSQTSPEGRSLTERQIAERLGITQPAVQYAKRLYRDMNAMGVEDPYRILTSPPATGKLRRHLHPRYRFEPLQRAG